MKRTWASGKWMLITVLAPEYLILENVAGFQAVNESVKKLAELAKIDGVPWTRTLLLFTNMGGFVLRSYVPDRLPASRDLQTNTDVTELVKGPRGSLNMAASEDAEPSGFGINKGEDRGAQVHGGRIMTAKLYYLTGRYLLLLRQKKALKRLPYITKDQQQKQG